LNLFSCCLGGEGGALGQSVAIPIVCFILFWWLFDLSYGDEPQPNENQFIAIVDGERVIKDKPGFIVPEYIYNGKVYHNARVQFSTNEVTGKVELIPVQI